MKTIRTLSWLSRATSYVRFRPDRRQVYSELYGHMIERNQGFLDSGMDEAAADEACCRAMGDPDEIGAALAAVHRPFWGRFLRLTRLILLALALLLAVNLIKGGWRELYAQLSWWQTEPQAVLYLEAKSTGKVTPQVAEARCGDFSFKLKEAVKADGKLYLLLETETWNVLLDGPPLFRGLSLTDSSGGSHNIFPIAIRRLLWKRQFILSSDWSGGDRYAMLTYDRNGKSFQLPVDLNGGGQ